VCASLLCAVALTNLPATTARTAPSAARALEQLPAQGAISPDTQWTLRQIAPGDAPWCVRYRSRDAATGASGTYRECGPDDAAHRGGAQFVLDCVHRDLVVFGGGRSLAAVELRSARRRVAGRLYRGSGRSARTLRFFVVHVDEHRRALRFQAFDAANKPVGEPYRIPGRSQLCDQPQLPGVTAYFPFTF
jgi:hypothetical protein